MEADARQHGFVFCWGRVSIPMVRVNTRPACAVPSFKNSPATRNRLKTPGSTKDYIYIDDLAIALLTVLGKNSAAQSISERESE